METTGNALVIDGKVSETSLEDDKEVVDAVEISTNNNIECPDDSEAEDQDEDLKLGDTSNLTTVERNALFQRGLEYEQKDKPNAALQCYLGCLQGLKNKSLFVLLPQCLHNIADIYRAQENYERAIHFAQAEKLFYETSLIETEEIQKKIEDIASDNGNGPSDLNELNIDALRAEEYEHLAKLCLDKKQPQLAMEYAGKCTKLRQKVYGDNHDKTKTSLNFFAALYAEVGRLQYSDSINLLNQTSSEDADNESEAAEDTRSPEVIVTHPAGGEPVSILRQRSEDSSKETDREKKQVRFHKSVDESSRRKEREELISFTMTLILLAVCVVILASMGMWLYCSLDQGHSCQSLLTQLQQWVRTLQYYYHTLTSPRPPA